jgi:hypothetical protein
LSGHLIWIIMSSFRGFTPAKSNSSERRRNE